MGDPTTKAGRERRAKADAKRKSYSDKFISSHSRISKQDNRPKPKAKTKSEQRKEKLAAMHAFISSQYNPKGK